MKKRSIALAFATTGLLMLAGCTTTSEAPEVTDDSSSADTGSEFSQGETPVADRVTEAAPAMVDLGTAYFDYNRSEIRGDMRAVLRANANMLGSSSAVAVIEGHADERGSEEYNLALGQRRAESVRKYLSALGVPSSQMRIVSYGEARPAARGHDESAWRLNRRAEFRAR